jgi:aminopeptidase-like protein
MSIIEHNTIPRGDYAAIIGSVPVVRPANTNQPSANSAYSVGERMLALATKLYPVCRSLTGPGVRETLEILQSEIRLQIHSVASGTQVFDWNVPQEWTLRSAFIEDANGQRVVDAQHLNLHVVNYSDPIDTTLAWSELKDHLHTLPEQPDLVPYRTSYYHRTWGFCLSQRQYEQLAANGENAQYHVQIDATLADGELNYGEFYLPGETTDEILFSCHICHPSLANDNLSGNVVAVELAKWLLTQPIRRYSYRILFVPATIGTLCWLSANQASVANIKHGLVLTLLGDAGRSTYKQSRQGNAEIDRVVQHVLQHAGSPCEIRSFTPQGYDERQYCSPGFNLPVGCLMRTPHGEYPEYHTSADNLSFIRPEALQDSWQKCCQIVSVLEQNRSYQNLSPYGEPQLGKRGLYQKMGGDSQGRVLQAALLWVLNFSDGEHSLLDIAERAQLPFTVIHQASELLLEVKLLGMQAPTTDLAPDAAPLSLDELWFS